MTEQSCEYVCLIEHVPSPIVILTLTFSERNVLREASDSKIALLLRNCFIIKPFSLRLSSGYQN
jgi:hypothetical protein